MFSSSLKSLFSIFILICFSITNLVYAQELYFSTGEEALNNVFKSISVRSEELPALVDREIRKKQPLFIFIPGILGSKLMNRSKEVLWGVTSSDASHFHHNSDQGGEVVGDLTPSDENPLKYDSNKKILVDLLEDYEILTFKVDVYGKFFKMVKLLDVSNVRHLLYFPYDWRQDNRKSADKFNEELKKDKWKKILNKREIVLVAHSMGGLVVTYWFHKYYKAHKNNYPFKIKQVIFIGTPHTGTLSALQSLIKGYHTDPNSNWFFRRFEDSIFDSLNGAGHTFPSIYQLLPFHNNELITLKTVEGLRSNPPIYDIESWKQFDFLKKTRSNKDKNAFYDSIKPLLEDGVKFHDELNKMGPVPDAVYFYSNLHKTPTHLDVVEKENGEFEPEFIRSSRSGDGVVTRKSATNLFRIWNEELPRGLSKTHGQLPKDDIFIDYIDLFRQQAINKRGKALAELSSDHPVLFNELVNNKVLLEVPILQKMWSQETIGKIIDTNNKIVWAAYGRLKAPILQKMWSEGIIGKTIDTNNKIVRPDYRLWGYNNVPEIIFFSAKATKDENIRNKLFSLVIAQQIFGYTNYYKSSFGYSDYYQPAFVPETFAQASFGYTRYYSANALALSLRRQGKLEFAEPFAEMAVSALDHIPEEKRREVERDTHKNLKEIKAQRKEEEKRRQWDSPKTNYNNGKPGENNGENNKPKPSSYLYRPNGGKRTSEKPLPKYPPKELTDKYDTLKKPTISDNFPKKELLK